jgi:hypothetical protein
MDGSGNQPPAKDESRTEGLLADYAARPSWKGVPRPRTILVFMRLKLAEGP